MRENALYFPYINVPDTAWFTRILLYWDRVSAIVPYEYVDNPDQLAPHMRELVAAGLVEQLFPGPHLYELPRFTDAFMVHLERKLRMRRDRPHRIGNERPVLLHIEKLGDIAGELVRAGVARPAGYPWFQVEPAVAADFMIYLALTLGQLQEINAAPVTNDPHSFRILGGANPRGLPNRQAVARAVILRHILPAPQGRIAITQMADFKAKHGHLLRNLRRRVEARCTEISNIEDPALRITQSKRVAEELAEEVNRVREEMNRRWKNLTFSAILPIIGGVAGFGAGGGMGAALSGGSSLISSAYTAHGTMRQQQELVKGPLAYAALAWREFPRLLPLHRDQYWD